MTRPDSHNTILINGQPADSISIYDRGLQYGDGLFETIAVVDSQPLLIEKHLARLSQSAQLLKFPALDIDNIKQELIEFSHKIDKAIVKLIVTRGVGGRGYGLPASTNPNRILIQYPWPTYPDDMLSQGVALRVCDLRLSKQPHFFGSKHMNRLEQILARSEWDDASIFEGMLLDEDGKIIEGTMSNVVFIKDKILITPDLNASGVKGVLREVILEQAMNLGYKTQVSEVNLEDLQLMQECFICNSIIGVCPVKAIAELRFNDMQQSKTIREYLLQQNMIANL